jgi:hypothetical protein
VAAVPAVAAEVAARVGPVEPGVVAAACAEPGAPVAADARGVAELAAACVDALEPAAADALEPAAAAEAAEVVAAGLVSGAEAARAVPVPSTARAASANVRDRRGVNIRAVLVSHDDTPCAVPSRLPASTASPKHPRRSSKN